MARLWGHILTSFFISLLLALIAYVLGGIVFALVAFCFCLLFWLAWQFFYIFKLAAWLEAPKTDMSLPKNKVWADIFSSLQKRLRKQQARKQKLGKLLRRFYRAAEVLPNGILVIDKHDRISWVNGMMLDHLHIPPQAVGSSVLKNVIQQSELLEFLQKRYKDPQKIKLNLPRNNGVRERTLMITKVSFPTNEDLLITDDISEAEQVNTMRTAFVANVSHELRTPLTVINGFLETMALSPELKPEQSSHFISLMRKEGVRMQMLLEDLLTLSRLESVHSVERTPIDLSSLAKSLAEEAEMLSDGNHTIKTDIVSDLWVSGVYSDLYNGLSNLVFNAVRYTPAGGEIIISVKIVPSENIFMLPPIRFAVKDNGPGIAAEHIPHLTERFYRVDKGRSRQSGGTGLGLAIVKYVLVEHETTLEINSEVGKGSEFATVFKQVPPARLVLKP